MSKNANDVLAEILDELNGIKGALDEIKEDVASLKEREEREEQELLRAAAKVAPDYAS
jgi:hypothetical protein